MISFENSKTVIREQRPCKIGKRKDLHYPQTLSQKIFGVFPLLSSFDEFTTAICLN
jgi:hypothetical protein